MTFEPVQLTGLIQADGLAFAAGALVVAVAGCVMAYARRYMAGDRLWRRHLWQVTLVTASATTMVFADHVVLLAAAWWIGNLLLTRLMVHKESWEAARHSGAQARRMLLTGAGCLTGGLALLAQGDGTMSVRSMVSRSGPEPYTNIGLGLLALAVMVQSAQWPLHRWLLSSLNSPTPVSALMHAGLVNGGGLVLIRFAPLYLERPWLLMGLFAVGLVTAALGSFWKLLQSDVKRMLACSTMAQMGFMLMQCGMGLFGPAFSHLIWHGLFKAYLFLGAGGALREARVRSTDDPRPGAGFVGPLGGLVGALAFAGTSGLSIELHTTSCLMVAMAFMATAQVALGAQQSAPAAFGRWSAVAIAAVAGGLYGGSIHVVELAPGIAELTRAQPLNILYVAGFAVLAGGWLAITLSPICGPVRREIWKRLYVAGLNGAQPHPESVTSTRPSYRF